MDYFGYLKVGLFVFLIDVMYWVGVDMIKFDYFDVVFEVFEEWLNEFE